ncbi:sugar O-acetyltransferase [Phocaeicola dorei]|mgnify:FL=1|uniref:Acetyltransferase n=2 Tax=Phocaeicola dorei TaxID=357276 RepID=B6W4X6_9BACT|nr:sugar O-acetyltransferase [Phocaeicola dorei]EEB22944.1 bacterial transferase hexapeptide repeat protein [Phocaeicola dorei DSM 17855]QJR76603.1 sugar O-acetyltransferase [Phocaeicola dorei]UWN81359.1 sugar O-acetyltransferase [Phocaeicola dorei]
MSHDCFISAPYIFNEKMMERFRRAGDLTMQYNQTSEGQQEIRQSILAQLLGKQGKDVLIIPAFRCQYGSNIILEDSVIVNFNCTFMDNTTIHVGHHTLVGPNCSLYTVNHAIDADEREKGLCVDKPIHIGSRVWLGGNVVIMPGINIGNDSVIGAGSVVTKDIPNGVIAAGNPCRVLRPIDVKDRLL